MTANDIYKKIKELGELADNESNMRNTAQIIALSVENCSLSESEKRNLLYCLNKQMRSTVSTDFLSDNKDTVCVNSLLEELCLAASFYILEKEKHINLFSKKDTVFAGLNLRAFENCFFQILRELFIRNDEVCIYIKNSESFCSLIFRFENSVNFAKSILNNSFYLYENRQKSLCLKLQKSVCSYQSLVDEDFSLLLYDRMSPLHIWLCDI